MTHHTAPASLHFAVADLQGPASWRGALKPIVGSLALSVLLIYSVVFADPGGFLLASGFAGLIYASVVLTTHDAIHGTMSPSRAFNGILARMLSYPGLWFYGVYRRLHLLHHLHNGIDPDDPERTQWTASEYLDAGPLSRWRMRNGWMLDLFVLGGIGLIARHVARGVRLARHDRAMKRALVQDAAGILLTQTLFYSVAIYFGRGWHWFFCFLVMERITGFFAQLRGHVEHEGLWGEREQPLLRYVTASRNIKASSLVSAFFNDLNFHSVHHAFPRIPRHRLREAHQRLKPLFAAAGVQLTEEPSYLQTAWRLLRNRPFLDEKSDGFEVRWGTPA